MSLAKMKEKKKEPNQIEEKKTLLDKDNTNVHSTSKISDQNDEQNIPNGAYKLDSDQLG